MSDIIKEIEKLQALLGYGISNKEMNDFLDKWKTIIQDQHDLIGTLKTEAQLHAGEAKAANASLNEIYQLVSGATGEKANWNGAKPVKEFIQQQEAEIERYKKALSRLAIGSNYEEGNFSIVAKNALTGGQ